MKSKGLIRFGASSFSSKDWVGPFYPEGMPARDFLRYYADQFDTVEVDSTYYAIPSAATVDGWAEKTPEDFLLSAKFPRAVVHGGEGAKPDGTKLLSGDEALRSCDRFLQVMSRLGSRLGPLLIQFPYLNRSVFPGAGPFMERLAGFLERLPKDFRYAVEIRNKAWLKPDFADLCREHNAAVTLVDQGWMPMPDELQDTFDPVTTDFAYVRLLGDRKEIEAITKSWGREVIDRGDRLRRWAEILTGLSDRDIPTVVYVNNHYAGHAPETVRRLQALYAEAMERRGPQE